MILEALEKVATRIGLGSDHNENQDGDDILKKLCYYEYIKDKKVFRNRNGQIAVAYAFDDIPLDNKITEEAKEDVLTNVTNMLCSFDSGSHVQIIKRIHKNIRDLDKIKEFYMDGEPLARRILEEDLKKFYSGAEEKPLFKYNQLPFWIKKWDNLLTFVYTPKPFISKNRTGIMEVLNGKERYTDEYRKHVHDEIEAVENVCSVVESSISNLGIQPKRFDGQDLLTYLEEWFNPESSLQKKPSIFRDDLPIYQQILHNSPKSENDGYTFEEKKTRVLTIDDPPIEKTEVGMLSSAIEKGDDYKCLLDAIKEGIIIFNIYIDDPNDSEKRIGGVYSAHVRNTQTTRLKLDAKKKKKGDDCLHALDKISNENIKSTLTRIHILLRGTDKENKEVENKIATQIRNLRMRIEPEDLIGSDCEEQCWPFGFSIRDEDKRFMRSIELMADNVACMLPIYGSYTSNEIAPMILTTDRGTLYNYNPIVRGEANHIFISGYTGSGKSVFTLRLIAALLLIKKVMFFGIDIGGSQEQTIGSCRRKRYDVVDPKKPPCYNPIFGALLDDTKEQMLQRLYTMKEGEKGSGAKITQAQKSILSLGLTQVFNKKAKHITIKNRHTLEMVQNENFEDRDTLECKKYLDQGYILGYERRYAWLSYVNDLRFDNAKSLENSTDKNVTYKLYKAQPICSVDDQSLEIIKESDLECKQYKGITYIIYEKDTTLNRTIAKIADIKKCNTSDIRLDHEKNLAYVQYEDGLDLKELKHTRISFEEFVPNGDAYLQEEVKLREIWKWLNNPPLEDEDEIKIAKGLAMDLSPYCITDNNKGEYAAYFDGENTLVFDEKIMGWEFEGLLQSNEFIASLVLSSLVSQISMRVKDKKNIDYLKILVFDEAWKFIKASPDVIVKTIEYATRAWRKNNGLLICTTQTLSELLSLPGGPEIFGMFPTKIHLRQENPELIIAPDALKEPLLAGRQAKLFRKLKKASGDYSEGMLFSRGIWLKFKLIMSGYAYWQTTTADEDKPLRTEVIEELMREQNYSLQKAKEEAPAVLAERYS